MHMVSLWMASAVSTKVLRSTTFAWRFSIAKKYSATPSSVLVNSRIASGGAVKSAVPAFIVFSSFQSVARVRSERWS